MRTQSNQPSSKSLKDIERKLQDEVELGALLDSRIAPPTQAPINIMPFSNLVNYSQTLDVNVRRVFVMRMGVLSAVVYHNILNETQLLVEMKFS